MTSFVSYPLLEQIHFSKKFDDSSFWLKNMKSLNFSQLVLNSMMRNFFEILNWKWKVELNR